MKNKAKKASSKRSTLSFIEGLVFIILIVVMMIVLALAIVARRSTGNRLFDSVLLVVVRNGRLDSLLSQHRAVHLYGRQSLKCLNNGRVGKCQRLIDALALIREDKPHIAAVF